MDSAIQMINAALATAAQFDMEVLLLANVNWTKELETLCGNIQRCAKLDRNRCKTNKRFQ